MRRLDVPKSVLLKIISDRPLINLKSLAAVAQVSPKIARRLCKVYDLKLAGKHTRSVVSYIKLTAADVEELRARHAAGDMIKELARRYKISRQRIYELCGKRRTPAVRAPKVRKPRLGKHGEKYNMLLAGPKLSNAQLAAQLGISLDSLYQLDYRRRLNGLPTMNPSGRPYNRTPPEVVKAIHADLAAGFSDAAIAKRQGVPRYIPKGYRKRYVNS
jgi:hypothetical protein